MSPPSSVVVLDASALLSFLHQEPGGEIIRPKLPMAMVCSVNWSEVLQKAQQRGIKTATLGPTLTGLGMRVVPFSVQDAEVAASLWRHTSPLGLSLGDRACLALAKRLDVPVYTADRIWKKAQGLGVSVHLIR